MVLGAIAATTLMASAVTANAAIYINFSPAAGDGSISGSFGYDGNAPVLALGAFDHTYLFNWPLDGVTSATVSSSFTSNTNDLDFTSVTLNGIALDFVTGGLHHSEYRSVDLQPTLSGLQTLEVKGFTRGEGSTYAGTLTFSPNAVPEPATWGLMIMGFGGAGAMLRNRRRQATLA